MKNEKSGISSYTRWICEAIKDTCKKHGGRPGGSHGTKSAMLDMMREGAAYSDTAELYPFTMHPEAFIGSISLGAFFDVMGVNFFILFLIYPYPVLSFLSALLFFISVSVVFFEFFLYLPFTDRFYPERKSHNLLLTRRAEGMSRRKIILVGHCDSAYELPFINRRPRALFITLITGAALGKALGLLFGTLSIFFTPTGTVAVALGAVECALLVFFVPFLFFVNWDCVTDGANDNLTGCFLGLSILKEMNDGGERLSNTDLCCLITDGEESGLRGAFAFAKDKAREFREANTVVIAVDTIHDPKELMIYDRGINFTQKNGEVAKNLLKTAGRSLGIDIPLSPFYPGATDAEAFSRAGVEASAICAVSHEPCDYYHTESDTHTNLCEGGIELVRRILISAIKIYDSGYDG